jgi:hypothetical protein
MVTQRTDDQTDLGQSEQEKERHLHWSQQSQVYASAEVLTQRMRDGWRLGDVAAVETFYYGGYRWVEVYYFTLLRGESRMELPVLANPVVLRLIHERGLSVVRVNTYRGDEHG